MKKAIIWLLAAGMVGLWGCSAKTKTINYLDLPQIKTGEYSTVYMFRESRLYGYAVASPIQVNGVQWFQIGSGDCVTFQVPTGPCEIIFVPEWKQVKFVSEKGKKYYIYLRLETGKADADFRQLTEEEWKEKQKACNWVELKKK